MWAIVCHLSFCDGFDGFLCVLFAQPVTAMTEECHFPVSILYVCFHFRLIGFRYLFFFFLAETVLRVSQLWHGFSVRLSISDLPYI